MPRRSSFVVSHQRSVRHHRDLACVSAFRDPPHPPPRFLQLLDLCCAISAFPSTGSSNGRSILPRLPAFLHPLRKRLAEYQQLLRGRSVVCKLHSGMIRSHGATMRMLSIHRCRSSSTPRRSFRSLNAAALRRFSLPILSV